MRIDNPIFTGGFSTKSDDVVVTDIVFAASAAGDLTITPDGGIVKIAGKLGILEGGVGPTKYTYFQGSDQTDDLTYTLPAAFPASIAFLKISSSGTMTTDTSVYLTSLTGAMLLDQTTPQTVINGQPTFGQGLKITAGQDIRPSADSTTAINIAQADGTDFVTFDTTNKYVGIGTITPGYPLDVTGAINSTTNIFGNKGVFAAAVQVNGGYLVTRKDNIGTTSTDGIYTHNTFDATDIVPVQISPRLRFSGKVWDTGLSSSLTSSWIVENVPISGNPATNRIDFSSDPGTGSYSPIMSMLSTGYVGIGTSSPTKHLHLMSTAEGADVSFDKYSTTDGVATQLFFRKSANATKGSHTLLNSGEMMGSILFQGSDGSQFRDSARIKAEVDATPGSSDMPGRLVFETSPDGSITLTERMRIDSAGKVGICVTPTERLEVAGNVFLNTDNYKLLFGTAKDASIYYDGTNLVVNPKEVGTGGLSVSGNITLNDGIFYIKSSSSDGSIYGEAYNSVNVKANNLRSINFLVGPSGSEVAALRISGNKNVGIQSGTPTANLQVSQLTTGPGRVSISGTAVTGVGTQFTNTFKVGDTITVTTTSGSETKAITTITSDTDLVTEAFAGTASSVDYTLTGGTRFAVLGNGNIGVGTVLPTAKLHLVNNGDHIRLGSTSTRDFVFSTDTGASGRLFLNTINSSTGLTDKGVFTVVGTDGIISVGQGLSLTDSKKITFGAANDASIYYDGTNLVVNPKDAGTGILDVKGVISSQSVTSTASLGAEILVDQTGAVASANGVMLTKSVDVTNGESYYVTWTQTGSVANNGLVRPALGIVNGGYYSSVSTSAQNYAAVLIANTTATVNLTFTVSSYVSGTITIANTVSVKLITKATIASKTLNSDSSIGIELLSGGIGLFNTFIGKDSGKHNVSGSYNIANGYQALYSNVVGFANSAIGYQSLYLNTTGGYNTANGFQSLYSNTTGSNNTANGYMSLFANTTGGSNTASGMYSLTNNTTGSNNTANGYYSLRSNTTGSNNTANGYYSLSSNTTGNNNTASGYYSLNYNTTGTNNTANGYLSLYSNTTGVQNTSSGLLSLYTNTTGSYNTANGFQSLYSNTTGSNNTANGYMSLFANTTRGSNTASGMYSLYSNVTGNSNTANGMYSLRYNTTGSYNTANGSSSTGIYPARPISAIAANGLVDVGVHNYLITYVINGVEHPSEWRSGTTTAVNKTVNLSGISVYSGPQPITYKRVYRTLISGGFTGTCTVSGGSLAGGTVSAAGSFYQAVPVFTVTTKDAGTGGTASIVVGGLSSATTEPTWNTTTGTYTEDNQIMWICSGVAAGTEEVWKVSTAYTYSSILGDVITLSGTHGWETAQRIVYTTTGTAAIGNLTSGTTYFVILTGTGTEVKMAATAVDALAGNAITLGAYSGTGTITCTPTYYVSGTASVVKNVAGTYKFTAVAGGILSLVCSGGSGYTVAPNITITKYPTNNQYAFYKVADLALGDATYSDTSPDIKLLTDNVPLPTGMSRTILLGAFATGTGSGQFVVGDSQYSVPDTYLGGVFRYDAGVGLAHTVHSMGANGTDQAGGNLILAGGKGTGTGAGGSLIFQTAPATTTGSTENSLVTSMTILSDGSVVISKVPTGVTSTTSSLVINPASATADADLIWAGVNGAVKFQVDEDGDATVGGNLTVSGTINMPIKRTISMSFDGGGVEIAAGSVWYTRIPYDFTATSWTILADVAGAIKVDVWVDNYASYPPTDADSVTNGHEPEIVASANKAEDTNLSDWSDVSWAAGQIIAINVDSCTTITKALVLIDGTSTD